VHIRYCTILTITSILPQSSATSIDIVALIAIRATSYWEPPTSSIRQSSCFSKPWTLHFPKQLPCSVPTSLLDLSQPRTSSTSAILAIGLHAVNRYARELSPAHHVRLPTATSTSATTSTPLNSKAPLHIASDSPPFTSDCTYQFTPGIATLQ